MILSAEFIIADMRRERSDAKLRAEQEELIRNRDARSKEHQEKREKDADDAQFVGALIEIEEATADEIEALKSRIDRDQERVLEALAANSKALDKLQKRIDDRLEQAYVLEDGTRVFKTEDGTRVIDENGQEIDMDPDLIEDFRPSAEDHLQDLERRQALQEERDALTDYQARLDTSEDKLDAGNLSADDLRELDDLLADAPQALRTEAPQRGQVELSQSGSTPAVGFDAQADEFQFGMPR